MEYPSVQRRRQAEAAIEGHSPLPDYRRSSHRGPAREVSSGHAVWEMQGVGLAAAGITRRLTTVTLQKATSFGEAGYSQLWLNRCHVHQC